MSVKRLTRAGRGLAVLWAGWWTLFGLTVGVGEGHGLVAVAVHTVLPGTVFFVPVVMAWRWRPWGAVALLGMGEWMVLSYPFARTLEGFLLLGLPPMAAAGLLLAAWWPRKKHEVQGAL